MINKIVFCQVNSNGGYPKTVTGVVDFGNEIYTVFTQEQKKKILEKVLRLEDCEASTIYDSMIISKFQEKVETDSAALSLCEKEREKNKEINDLSAIAIINKEEQLVKKDIELKESKRREKRQKLFKKIGVGVGTGVGVLVGVVAGYFGAKLEQKLGQ